MATLYEKREGQIDFIASAQKRLELSKNYNVQYYMVKLTATHTNAAGAALFDSKLWGLINHLEIVANGNNTIKSIPASKLFINSIIGTGKAIEYLDLSEGADRVSTVFALIPMSQFRTVRAHDTILDTGLFKTLDLLINWGSNASIGTGITVSDAKLEVFSSALIGYQRNQGETIKYFVENNVTDEVTNTTTAKEVKLPTGHIYKALTVVSSVDGVNNDSMIKGIKIKSGNTVYVDLDADAIRSKNIFEIAPDDDGDLKGIYHINFASRGRLSDALDTRTLNTLEIVLDVEKQAGTSNDLNILSDIIHDTLIVP